MSKMLASSVKAAIAAACPSLLESQGSASSPATFSTVNPSAAVSRSRAASISVRAVPRPEMHPDIRPPARPEVRGEVRTETGVDPRTRSFGTARLHAVKVITAPRVRLDLTLPLERGEAPDTKLHHLMHSGLGVYIADIQVTSRKVQVELNLARDDIDFAFHTLVSKLSEAIIGPVCPRAALG